MANKIRFFIVTITEAMTYRPITEGVLTEQGKMPEINYLSRLYTDRIYGKEHANVPVALMLFNELQSQAEFEQFLGVKLDINKIINTNKVKQ